MTTPTIFQAKYRGESLGYFASAEEAEAAIEQERQAERTEAADLERELWGDGGCPGSSKLNGKAGA